MSGQTDWNVWLEVIGFPHNKNDSEEKHMVIGIHLFSQVRYTYKLSYEYVFKYYYFYSKLKSVS